MSAGAIDLALAAPPEELGQQLLRLTENQWFERKSIRIEPRTLAEAITAFANADGGTIVVGLHAGVIEGVDSDPKRVNALMQAAIDFTEPVVVMQSTLRACIRDDGHQDRLLVIEVSPARIVHATKKDEAFLRIGDESRKLTFAQRRELFYDKSQSSYESEPTTATFADLDTDLVDGYVESLGASDRDRLLAARDLAQGDVLTVAGALLFAQHPEHYLPSAEIRICRFRGTRRESGSRQNLVIDERLAGPIPLLLDAAHERVRGMQPTRRALAASGRFEDIGIVPEEAWLEGIVNAVVHRSYSMQGDHIHVDIYDDRIEIESPGRFPGLVDLAHPLEIARFARNPRVARVCTDLRITQELGEGIRRMIDEMRRAGLSDPIYHQTSGSVRLTLSGEPVTRELTAQLPAIQQRILSVLREADALSTGEITEAVEATRPTVLRHLEVLREGGYVNWSGKSRRDPRASWRAIR